MRSNCNNSQEKKKCVYFLRTMYGYHVKARSILSYSPTPYFPGYMDKDEAPRKNPCPWSIRNACKNLHDSSHVFVLFYHLVPFISITFSYAQHLPIGRPGEAPWGKVRIPSKDPQFQFNERSLVLKPANTSTVPRIPTTTAASAFLHACVKVESNNFFNTPACVHSCRTYALLSLFYFIFI